jgi:hypothetical protein
MFKTQPEQCLILHLYVQKFNLLPYVIYNDKFTLYDLVRPKYQQ